MNIIDAQYVFERESTTVHDHIVATIDGVKIFIPISEDNRHYKEIMRQVEAGELTIADAD
jgi:hypothetical protein